MDHDAIASSLGWDVAVGTTVYTAQIEARVTRSPIAAHPVPLEPPFRPFDPLQTFARTTRPTSPERINSSGPWRFAEVILPKTERPDYARAAAFLSSLAGASGVWSVEVHLRRRRRARYVLGAPSPHLDVLASQWLSAFPDSAIIPCTDPLDVPLIVRSLYDYYSTAPYHRLVQSTISPWPSFLRLTTALQDDDALFLQVLATTTRANWQHNISALSAAEVLLGPRAPFGRTPTNNLKSTSDPLFASVIRVACTNPCLSGSLEALAGNYTSDGKPLGYRTLSDFQRLLTSDEIIRFLQERTSHVHGQLLTPRELALLIHPPTTDAANDAHLWFLTGLPVPLALQHDGMYLGVNNDRGTNTRVYQPLSYNQNTWMPGTSGKGKSTVILHLAVRRAKLGQGICLLDPHRTTATKLLGLLGDIDPTRVIFLDFERNETVAYNPFAGNNEDDYGRLAGEYANSLKHLIGAEGFFRIFHLLTMSTFALLVLQENVASIIDLLGCNGSQFFSA